LGGRKKFSVTRTESSKEEEEEEERFILFSRAHLGEEMKKMRHFKTPH
jgi:hypothetical protein